MCMFHCHFGQGQNLVILMPSIHPQSPPKECVACGCTWMSSSLCGSHKALGVWVLPARPTGVWAWPEYLINATHLEIALSCASFICSVHAWRFTLARLTLGGVTLLGSCGGVGGAARTLSFSTCTSSSRSWCCCGSSSSIVISPFVGRCRYSP